MAINNWIKGAFGIGIASILSYGIYSLLGGEKKTKKKSKTEQPKTENSQTELEVKPKVTSSEVSTKVVAPKDTNENLKFNVEMMNLRTIENWKAIIERTKESENLLAKTFLAEAYFRIEGLEKTKEILNSIISQTPKDDYEEVAIGKAHQLNDNREEAFKWFEKAASKSNPIALYTLGVYYQNGIFVSKDEKKGHNYFRMATNVNEPISQYLYALTLQDTKEAASLFKKSSDWNYIPALMAMGDTSVQTGDFTLAAEYFKKCSDLDYCPGLRSLSYLLMNGRGVEKDQKTGIELLLKGIALGDVESSVTLSTYYQSGTGVEKDEKVAFDLCDKLDIKTPVVYYQLSLFYLNGVGCEPNEKKHLDYLSIAAKARYPAALYLLGNYLLGNPSNDEDITTGIDYLAEAAKMGHAAAISQLQQIYEQTFQGKEEQIME
jgi:TPR repeat protein